MAGLITISPPFCVSWRFLVAGGRRNHKTCSNYYHYRKPRVRRVPQCLPCVFSRAHGEQNFCRAPRTKHTANRKHTATRDFAVCPSDSPRRNGLHVNGRVLQLNAVSIRRVPTAQHTANLLLCRVPWGSTRRSHGPVNRSQRPVDVVAFAVCRS